MFLLTMLVIIAVILLVLVVLAVGFGGAGFIVLFGDVIVCIGFIALIIRAIIKKRRKRGRRP